MPSAVGPSLRLLTLAIVSMVVATSKRCSGEELNQGDYVYSYSVDGGDVELHHREERTGDLVRGSYSLMGADGRVRHVNYEVIGPEGGFRASVGFRSPPQPDAVRVRRLQYPQSFSSPVRHVLPVARISVPKEAASNPFIYRRTV